MNPFYKTAMISHRSRYCASVESWEGNTKWPLGNLEYLAVVQQTSRDYQDALRTRICQKKESTAAIFEVSFNGDSMSIDGTNLQSLITFTVENVLPKC